MSRDLFVKDVLDASFARVGFTQEALHAALRSMCPRALKGFTAAETAKMRAEWTPANPTRNCCYFTSEMVYWFVAPYGSRAMSLRFAGDLHRYVLWPDGQVVDLTCDQFELFDVALYRDGKPRAFMQTGGPGPSRRARQLAAALGFTETVMMQSRDVRL